MHLVYLSHTEIRCDTRAGAGATRDLFLAKPVHVWIRSLRHVQDPASTAVITTSELPLGKY